MYEGIRQSIHTYVELHLCEGLLLRGYVDVRHPEGGTRIFTVVGRTGESQTVDMRDGVRSVRQFVRCNAESLHTTHEVRSKVELITRHRNTVGVNLL